MDKEYKVTRARRKEARGMSRILLEFTPRRLVVHEQLQKPWVLSKRSIHAMARGELRDFIGRHAQNVSTAS